MSSFFDLTVSDDALEDLPTIPEGIYDITLDDQELRVQLIRTNDETIGRRWRASRESDPSKGDRPGSCFLRFWTGKRWLTIAWVTGQRCNPNSFFKMLDSMTEDQKKAISANRRKAHRIFGHLLELNKDKLVLHHGATEYDPEEKVF